MESAIPEHLQPPRTRHRAVCPTDYSAALPRFCRAPQSRGTGVMAYFVVRAVFRLQSLEQAKAQIALLLSNRRRPAQLGTCTISRRSGFHHSRTSLTVRLLGTIASTRWLVFRARDGDRHQRSLPRIRHIQRGAVILRGGSRPFLFVWSGPKASAVLADAMSGEFRSQCLFGAASRKTASDSRPPRMAPAGTRKPFFDAAHSGHSARKSVPIRSGQDWGDTETAERMCIAVSTVLKAGMDFLRAKRLFDRFYSTAT